MNTALKGLLTGVIATFLIIMVCVSMPSKDEAIGIIEKSMDAHFPGEYEIIKKAAIRNGINVGTDNEAILYAIRLAENGPSGREFGIMNPKAHDLDTQAGWCAASIVKGRQRWIDAGKPEDFITHFGRRYCPPDAHPLNKNWVENVTYWTIELQKAR